MGYITATPFLAPVLYLQGKHARNKTVSLPEAGGPREGIAGQGPLMRLLVLGDSSAAGVGAATQHEAFVGGLVESLSKNAQVEWRLIAKTGATTASTLRHLAKVPAAHYDVVIICLGVNDVTSRTGLYTWLEAQRQLRSLLRNQFGATRLIVNGLPLMGRFPALPQPLRWYMGSKARQFSLSLEHELKTEADCDYHDLGFATDVNLMSADGFHPGPEVYREWSERVALLISGR